MIDIVNSVMQPMAILAISIVGFILVFRTKSKKYHRDHYTEPDWNFFLKKWYAESLIRRHIKAEQKKGHDEYKKKETEAPRPLEVENSSDSHLIFGQDSEGNSLLIKITRRRHRISEVWLVLRLKDGRTFTLPDHPNTQVFNVNGEGFDAGGLVMECLVPNSSWRITFRGPLRCGIRENWNADFNEDELLFVKFNFIWNAKTMPLYWPFDWSPKLMAASLATEPWRDGKWMKLLARSDSGGYDQFGALYGQVFIETNDLNNETLEINLPGLRQRRWGPNKIEHLHRTGSIIGACRDGTVFEIGAFSSKQGLTHAQFGNIHFPNGEYCSIDWTDFHLRYFGENGNLPKSQVVRFSAKKKLYTVVLHTRHESKVPLFGGRPMDWTSSNYAFDFIINGDEGKGVSMLWYNVENSEVSIPEPARFRRIHFKNVLPNPTKFVYAFNDKDAKSVHISGGKGASLAILTSISEMDDVVDNFYCNDLLFKENKSILKNRSRRESYEKHQETLARIQVLCPNFTVPAGAVLSVSAMDLMLQQNPKVNEQIEILKHLCGSGEDFEDQCNKIVEMIHRVELDKEVVSQIQMGLKQILSESSETRLAVRSSSVCEDGEDVSAAGQNETFLGLKSEADVMEAIKKCWASLYTYQSVNYRKQNIQPIKTGMAVVIQVMLAADSAGVLFSNHPITGDPKKSLISANFGLGESVVSGEIDPDNYIVKRNMMDNYFEVISKKIGNKKYKIQMSDSENLEKIEIGEEDSSHCLTDEQILKLTKIGVILEKLYGNGRDIEWAIKDDDIYLLQSRPITSLNAFTDWELIHEFDSPVMSEEDLATTANIQEVMCGVVTPLTISTVMYELDKRLAFTISGSDVSARRLFLRVNSCQCSLDVHNIFHQVTTKELDSKARINGYAIFGHHYMTEEIHSIAKKRMPPNNLKQMQMMKNMIRDTWKVKKISSQGVKLKKSFKNQYSAENLQYFKTARDLLENIEQNMHFCREISDIHSTTSSVSVFYQMISFIILTEGKDFNDEHLQDISTILSSAKDTESAEIPKTLGEIGKLIMLSGLKSEFCSINKENGMTWLEQNIPNAGQIFKDFIEKNQHRALKEFELITITWGMNPGLIIEMLQASVKYCDNVESLTKANNYSNLSPSEIVAQLKTPKKNFTRTILKKLIARIQKSVQYRELSKSNFVYIIHEFRIAYRHLGKLLANEGYLPHPELIFFLTLDELKQLLKTRNVLLVKKAIRRQRLHPQLNKLKFPELIFGVPKPVNTNKGSSSFTGNKIDGTSVYSGVVTGRACVIHEFSEVSKIEAGDILITHSTDIGWSPYFPILSGVVTELGGLISHGAVVAREYGLPCIVAAEGATQFFEFGETVTLDATQGIIYKENSMDC